MTLDPTFFVDMGESGAGERNGPRKIREGEREKENKRPRDTEENEHGENEVREPNNRDRGRVTSRPQLLDANSKLRRD